MLFKQSHFVKSCISAALLLALTSPAFAADTIKIGVGGAHSGELASYGLPSLNAARLVAEEFNAKGGLLGKQIEIVAADDQCKPEVAPNAATSLLSEEVVGVIGMICSGATKAALPIFTEANIVTISPSATTPELTLSGANKTFFRTIGHDLTQANVSSKFIATQKPKTVAILHDNGEYGKGFAESVRSNIETSYPEIKVVLFEAVTPGAPDYSSTVRKVRNEGAEFLVWGGYHPEASKIVNNMYDLGFEIPFLGPDGLKDDTFITTAGEASEGVYASGPADTADLPASKAAAEAHQKAYDSAPGAFFYNAYAATYALVKAIEAAGTTDTDKVMEALRSNTVDTSVGSIKFDQNGDAEGISMSIYQVQDGVYTPVFTD